MNTKLENTLFSVLWAVTNIPRAFTWIGKRLLVAMIVCAFLLMVGSLIMISYITATTYDSPPVTTLVSDIDNCKTYRITESFQPTSYFTKCTDTKNVSTTYSVTNGKTVKQITNKTLYE